MIKLEDLTRAGAPTSAYPFGFIINETGSNNGTVVDADGFNDLFQLKEKMFAESGITANGLPDNETNGFQLFQAFLSVLPKKMVFQWTSVFDGASHTITKASMEALFNFPQPFSNGFGTSSDKVDFQIELWYLASGTWTRIQPDSSVSPVITVSNTTGDITIVLNGAPISPAATVQAVIIG